MLALVLLALSAPLLLAIALVIFWSGGGPVLFRQERIGLGGRPFRMHKFRTLVADCEDHDRVAPRGDPRVTRLGAWLRDTRLDELPQLYDVLRGEMAFVGPRPETAANLGSVGAEPLRRWLSVRPGITGPTQLAFIAEDELLAGVPDPTTTYRRILVPAKVRDGIGWLEKRSVWGDLAVLLRTPFALLSRRHHARSRSYVASLLAGDSQR